MLDDKPFSVDLLNPESFPIQIGIYSKGQIMEVFEIEKIDEKHSKVTIVLDFTNRRENMVNHIRSEKLESLVLNGKTFSIDDLPEEATVERVSVLSGAISLLTALVNTGVFSITVNTKKQHKDKHSKTSQTAKAVMIQEDTHGKLDWLISHVDLLLYEVEEHGEIIEGMKRIENLFNNPDAYINKKALEGQ